MKSPIFLKYLGFLSISAFLFLGGCGQPNETTIEQKPEPKEQSSTTNYNIYGKWAVAVNWSDNSADLHLVECQPNETTTDPDDGILWENGVQTGTCAINGEVGTFTWGREVFVGNFTGDDTIDGTITDPSIPRNGKARSTASDYDVRGNWYQFWVFHEGIGHSYVTFQGNKESGTAIVSGDDGSSLSGPYTFINGKLVYTIGSGMQSAKIEATFFDTNTLTGTWWNPVDGTNAYKAQRLNQNI